MSCQHQGCHPGSGRLLGLRVWGARVVTTAEDGTTVVLHREEAGTWKVATVLKVAILTTATENTWGSHDATADWVARFRSGDPVTSSGVSVWHKGLESYLQLEEPCLVLDMVLEPPHLVLGVGVWPRESGLQVWHLDTRRRVRAARSSGKFGKLIVSNTHVGLMKRYWKGPPAVVLYEKRQFFDPAVTDVALWCRDIDLVELRSVMNTQVQLNTTSMVLVEGAQIYLQDFWVQRDKCRQQLEREREEEEKVRREEEEELRVVELMRSRPSYVEQERARRAEVQGGVRGRGRHRGGRHMRGGGARAR